MFLEVFDSPGVVLGSSWGRLGRSWGRSGTILDALGPSCGRLGPSRGTLTNRICRRKPWLPQADGMSGSINRPIHSESENALLKFHIASKPSWCQSYPQLDKNKDYSSPKHLPAPRYHNDFCACISPRLPGIQNAGRHKEIPIT